MNITGVWLRLYPYIFNMSMAFIIDTKIAEGFNLSKEEDNP